MPLHQGPFDTPRRGPHFHFQGLTMHRTVLLSGLYAIAIVMLALPYGLSL
jgi:hypothetical protein